MPQVVDQPYTAVRVAELGIGAAHDRPQPTTDSLSAALKVALNSPVTAADWAEAFQAPDPVTPRNEARERSWTSWCRSCWMSTTSRTTFHPTSSVGRCCGTKGCQSRREGNRGRQPVRRDGPQVGS